MKKTYPPSSSIFYKAAVYAGIFLSSAACPFVAAASSQSFSSLEDVLASDVPLQVLEKVIARDGESKKYDDLSPLDGGTVGIANFATGGLASLYREMDTNKYFGKSAAEMEKNFSTACRPTGRAGNDTGWGCYSKAWWRNGMAAFLKSSDSPEIQRRAWIKLMTPSIKEAVARGWNSPRQIAIALGVSNSVGGGGFKSLAQKNAWDAEKTLVSYAKGNKHRERRRTAINEKFP